MSTIVQLTQGSAEWLAYRQAKRNASESAAVMGLSPWTTPYKQWLIKTGRYVEPANAAMRRGTELEPAARRAYEEQSGLVMQPLVLEDGAYSASLDGITLEGDLIVEIKVPMRGQDSELWRLAVQGQMPEHYRIQIQHQLMVSGAATAHLWVFDGSRGALVEVDRDEAAMAAIRAAWDSFGPYLEGDVPPPLTEADTVIRGDAAWMAAAQEYAKAKRLADEYAEGLEQARKALLTLTHHPKESGAGVAVTRFWKVGAVDYKRVPELRGVNLTPYRGKSREEVRVAIS